MKKLNRRGFLKLAGVAIAGLFATIATKSKSLPTADMNPEMLEKARHNEWKNTRHLMGIDGYSQTGTSISGHSVSPITLEDLKKTFEKLGRSARDTSISFERLESVPLEAIAAFENETMDRIARKYATLQNS